MKLVFTLSISALIHATNAFSSLRNQTAGHIYPRVDQQKLENLDREQPHIDKLTGSQQEKSRILTGIGPEEAKDRWWDWDETCTDANDRAAIAAAFGAMISLAEQASSTLDVLQKNLPELPPQRSKPTKRNVEYIKKNDKAFAQMFGARDDTVEWVKDSFDLVTSRARSFHGRNGNKPTGLRFICDRKAKIKNEDGSVYCNSGTQALTLGRHPIPGKISIEPRWQFTSSSSITFCPPFFNDAEFPHFAVRNAQTEHTLDKIDCKERVLLHEYMHVEWIRNLNPRDDSTGYLNAAEAGSYGPRSSKVLPDCYAWYALYAYFNNEKGGCGDVWPASVKKPNTK